MTTTMEGAAGGWGRRRQLLGSGVALGDVPGPWRARAPS